MWKQNLKTELLSQPNQIFGLDAFRGLAALMVFVFHFYGFFVQNKGFIPAWTEPWLAGGHIGINIFFVLSGFLVFLSFVRSRSLPKYLWKRLIRILPLALAYLVVVFWYKGNFEPKDWQDLWIHVSFTQSLFQDHYHGQFPVMWTLSLEWLFYLFVPFYAWLTQKNFRLFVSGLIVLTLANWGYRFWIAQFFTEWSNFERIFYSEQLWGRFDHFALGIFLGIVYAKGLLKTPPALRGATGGVFKKIYPYLLTLIGLTGFFYLWHQFGLIGSRFREQIWLQIFFHFSIALAFTVFLAGFIALSSKSNSVQKSPSISLSKGEVKGDAQNVRAYGDTPWQNLTLKNLLAPTWLQYLGKISYGIYLWHFFVLEMFLERPFNLSQKILLVTATTIGLSVLSWELIEKPCLRLKKSP